MKALREMGHPQYRLRIGGLRVFYDVSGNGVEIVAVVPKEEAAARLKRWGTPPSAEGV